MVDLEPVLRTLSPRLTLQYIYKYMEYIHTFTPTDTIYPIHQLPCIWDLGVVHEAAHVDMRRTQTEPVEQDPETPELWDNNTPSHAPPCYIQHVYSNNFSSFCSVWMFDRND